MKTEIMKILELTKSNQTNAEPIKLVTLFTHTNLE